MGDLWREEEELQALALQYALQACQHRFVPQFDDADKVNHDGDLGV